MCTYTHAQLIHAHTYIDIDVSSVTHKHIHTHTHTHAHTIKRTYMHTQKNAKADERTRENLLRFE